MKAKLNSVVSKHNHEGISDTDLKLLENLLGKDAWALVGHLLEKLNHKRNVVIVRALICLLFVSERSKDLVIHQLLSTIKYKLLTASKENLLGTLIPATTEYLYLKSHLIALHPDLLTQIANSESEELIMITENSFEIVENYIVLKSNLSECIGQSNLFGILNDLNK